jgi:hypothetical protein
MILNMEYRMKKGLLFLLILIVIFMTSTCSSKRGESNVDELPDIDIPISNFNSQIVLEINPGLPQEHKNGDILVYIIRNRSSNPIIFEQDFGVKIFKKEGAVWKSVKNKWGYPEGENYLPTNSESRTGLGFSLMPDLEGITDVTYVRIVIIGHVKDKPSEQVGAFSDVLFSP